MPKVMPGSSVFACINKIVLSGILLFLSSSVLSAAPVNGKTFEHWTIRCESDLGEVPDKPCYVFQNLILKAGGSRVLHIAAGLHPQNKDKVVILVTMPLGISLPPGASLRIDENKPVKFLIERCEPEGCRGGFMLSETIKEQFETGQKATVTFHDTSRNPIEVSVSLDGFSAGLNGLH